MTHDSLPTFHPPTLISQSPKPMNLPEIDHAIFIKEQRAIRRRRKNPGVFITRLFLKKNNNNIQSSIDTPLITDETGVMAALMTRSSVPGQLNYFDYRGN